MTGLDAIHKALLINAAAMMAAADIGPAMGADGVMLTNADDPEVKEKAAETCELTGRHYRWLLGTMNDPKWFPDPPKIEGGGGLNLGGITGLNLPSILSGTEQVIGLLKTLTAGQTPAK